MRYSYTLLFTLSYLISLSAQQPLFEFPLPTEAYELRTIGQSESAMFFRHGDQLNHSLWRYLPANNELEQLTESDRFLVSAEQGEAGVYYAEKQQDRRYDLAPIQIFRIQDGERQIMGGLTAYTVEFIATAPGLLLLQVDAQLYLLDESEARLTSLGFFGEFITDIVYWQNSFCWISANRIFRAVPEQGIQLIKISDWWPGGLTPLNNSLIWQDSVHLYRYDGTNSPEIFYEFAAADFRDVNLEGGALLDGDRFVFSGPTDTQGQEPWITDGTAAGTKILKDVTTGSDVFGRAASSYPAYLHARNGQLHFIAYDSNIKPQYWTSDGTATGTVLQEELTGDGKWDRIYRRRSLSSGGFLLTADGPERGTEVVRFNGGLRSHDTNPGPGDSFIEYLALTSMLELSDDRLAIGSLTPEHGWEPFLLGSEGETWPLGDLSPGAAWSELVWLGEYEEKAYLLAGNEDDGYFLYGLDLTQAATLPDTPENDIDWVQTLRTAPNFNASFGYMYGTDLVPATDGGFFAGGSITAGTGRLRFAPDYPEERYDDGLPCFVVKYQANGKPLWQLGLPGNAYTADRPVLTTAPDGGVYAASRSTSEGFIHDQPFNPQAGSAYITRIDENGSVMWLRQFSLSSGYLYDMATDADGNLLLSGWFENRFVFGGQSIEAAFGVAFFALSLDPDGSVRYLRALDATENWVSRGGALGATFDADGNAYLLLNSISKNYSVSCNYGNMPATVVKLSPTGEVIWRREFLGNDAWYITDLALSSRGNVYLSGKFRGQLDLDGRTLTHETEACTLTGFMAKMDPSGRVRTARVLEDGRRPDDMLTQADGSYVLAGYRALTSSEDYPGYSHTPYGGRREQAFVAVYNEQDQLITEKTLQVRDEIEGGGFAKLLPLAEQQYLLYTELEGPLDTIGVTSTLSVIEPNIAMVAFQLPYELTDLPTDGTAERNALAVFPNPTADYVNLLTSDGDFRFEGMRLYNSLGQEVSAPLRLFETGQYQLDLRQLPAGQYWLTTEQGDQLLSYPIVRVGQK